MDGRGTPRRKRIGYQSSNLRLSTPPRPSTFPTPLEAFIQSREIKPAHLAKASGYSRQHLLRVRMGRMEPTRRCIAAIVRAARKLSREAVRPTDLFDLG